MSVLGVITLFVWSASGRVVSKTTDTYREEFNGMTNRHWDDVFRLGENNQLKEFCTDYLKATGESEVSKAAFDNYLIRPEHPHYATSKQNNENEDNYLDEVTTVLCQEKSGKVIVLLKSDLPECVYQVEYDNDEKELVVLDKKCDFTKLLPFKDLSKQ